MSSRIAVFSFDMPYPPHRGGRADIWRRLQALRTLGHRLLLVTWHAPSDVPSAEAQRAVRNVVDELLVFPIRRGPLDLVRRLALLPTTPSHVTGRLLSQDARQQVDTALARFAPALVWCEGIYPSAEAMRAAKRANVPWVYRSHNIEHLYMRRQSRAAKRWRDKLTLTLACVGLRRYEVKTLREADWVFDISCDDLTFWMNEGLDSISWLPPLAEAALLPRSDAPVRDVADVVFLGNLVTPNNVQGVEWLVRDIIPIVRRKRPHTTVVIAGSNPGPHVRSLCELGNVTLLSNPPDALAIYRGARVLVNPVRVGSGTHMKAIEMLFTDAPIVTDVQGTCGMPAEIKRMFRVASTAEDFAAEILSALDERSGLTSDRSIALRQFGLQGLEDALARAGTLIGVADNVWSEDVKHVHE